MTPIPAAAAVAISGALAVPQSTVTISVWPSASARATAAAESPCPSSRRLGTYGVASAPRQRRAVTRIVSPVSPSASKSPKTITLSPAAAAACRRATALSASGSSAGSCRPSDGSPKKASRSRAEAWPRAASTVISRLERPRAAPAAASSALTTGRVGSRQRNAGDRASVIATSLPSTAAPRLIASLSPPTVAAGAAGRPSCANRPGSAPR